MALDMLMRISESRRRTSDAHRDYDSRSFVAEARDLNITPHVSSEEEVFGDRLKRYMSCPIWAESESASTS